MQKTIQIGEQVFNPVQVSQLAEQHQLGQIRACYRRRLHRLLLWLLPIWFIAIFMPFLYYLYMAISSEPGQDAALWVQICGIVIFIFPVITSILGFRGLHPFWGFKAYLYIADHGLLFINGNHSEVVRWDEIEKFFWSNKRSISYLVRKDVPKFSAIEDMDQAHKVSMIVAGAITERLLPEMLAQYRRVGKVRFGSLSVMREGITDWGKSGPRAWAVVPIILWNEIEDVHFEHGKFGVKVNNEWKEWSNGFLSLYEISNPTVCVALIRQILQHRDQERE
jgi:hypothetical protein